VSRVLRSDGEQGRRVKGRRTGPARRCAETNDRSAWKSLRYGAGRTGRRATNSSLGGAYSHLGCRFDCPRGHRGKPVRREAAPGRGASTGRSQAAAALACVVRGGPGPAARGRHVAGPRTLGAPLTGARMSLYETSAPRVFLSHPPHIDTSRSDPIPASRMSAAPSSAQFCAPSPRLLPGPSPKSSVACPARRFPRAGTPGSIPPSASDLRAPGCNVDPCRNETKVPGFSFRRICYAPLQPPSPLLAWKCEHSCGFSAPAPVENTHLQLTQRVSPRILYPIVECP
jgi:hypothetical protein